MAAVSKVSDRGMGGGSGGKAARRAPDPGVTRDSDGANAAELASRRSDHACWPVYGRPTPACCRVTRLLPPQRDSDNPGAGAATRVSRSTRRGGAWHVLITSRSHPEHVAVAVASGRVQVTSQAVLIHCSSAPASAVGQMDSRKTG